MQLKRHEIFNLHTLLSFSNKYTYMQFGNVLLFSGCIMVFPLTFEMLPKHQGVFMLWFITPTIFIWWVFFRLFNLKVKLPDWLIPIILEPEHKKNIQFYSLFYNLGNCCWTSNLNITGKMRSLFMGFFSALLIGYSKLKWLISNI